MRAHEPTILLGLSACGGLFNEDVVRGGRVVRAADRLPSEQPDIEGRVHGGGGARVDRRALHLCQRQPLCPVHAAEPDRARRAVPVQQHVHLPRPGARRDAERARLCSDAMVYACSVACAESLTEAERAKGMVFPDLERIREVSLNVAVRVIEAAADEGLCTNLEAAQHLAHDPGLLREWAAGKMYDPMYVPVTDVVYTNTDSATGENEFGPRIGWSGGARPPRARREESGGRKGTCGKRSFNVGGGQKQGWNLPCASISPHFGVWLHLSPGRARSTQGVAQGRAALLGVGGRRARTADEAVAGRPNPREQRPLVQLRSLAVVPGPATLTAATSRAPPSAPTSTMQVGAPSWAQRKAAVGRAEGHR